THLILVDLTEKRITGADASLILGEAGITVNKNLIPFDKKSAAVTSGIRLGTAAVTTRGMKEFHMRKIAQFINEAIDASDDPKALAKIKAEVLSLTKIFPLYPELLKEK
ncbi:MAG: serine hydroxymethyltransferase, partial [Candidatus Omnitrophica bacterium]|nr:serine hydroxymethyltransferase [Candidatus Omnitrophota bacterium]